MSLRVFSCVGLAAMLLAAIGCGSKPIPNPETPPVAVPPQPEEPVEGPRRTAKSDQLMAACGEAGPRPSLRGFYDYRDYTKRRERRLAVYTSAQQEAGIARALSWLAQHQAADGHWSLDRFHEDGRCTCSGAGMHNDIAATALGLLPLLGVDQTHQVFPYKENRYVKVVERGLQYLISKQNARGGFGDEVLTHALATMALCEAYGLTEDKKLHQPAQRALDFIVKSQQESGGWRTDAQEDTIVSAWQLLALKAGEAAGLEVPAQSQDRLMIFLDSVATLDGARYGRFGAPRIVEHGVEPASAAGLLCRQYLGWGPKHPCALRGADELKNARADPDVRHPELRDLTYLFFATQVMYNLGGGRWDVWDVKARNLLIASQDQGGDVPHQQGSWLLVDKLLPAPGGGRIASTALATLILETPYRYPPLYQPKRDEEK